MVGINNLGKNGLKFPSECKKARTVLQPGFLLFVDVGPQEKKTLVSLVREEEGKQECPTSYDRAAQMKLIYLTLPNKPKP